MSTKEELYQRIANLSPEKRRVFEEQLLRKKGKNGKYPPITLRQKGETVPLSFAQERLWLLDQFDSVDSVYSVPILLRMKGPIQLEILEKSLNALVERHEILRTSYTIIDEQPVQLIASSLRVEFPIINLENLSADDRIDESHCQAFFDIQEPFDLTRAPLLRVKVWRLGENDHVLLLNLHHIVCDAWSMKVFHSELSLLYQGFCNGDPTPLAPLPIQYADFAQWQHHWFQGERLSDLVKYWEGRLRGAPMMLEIPTDRPRPLQQTYRGDNRPIDFPEELSVGIRRMSQQEGVTVFMTLFTAIAVCLSRYTGQSDILIGSPISNRMRPEVEGLIGFFVNTLVLRADLSGDPTVRELLQRIRVMTLEAFDHQDVPFEHLFKVLMPERDLSRSPIFQVMFAFGIERGQKIYPFLQQQDLVIEPMEVLTKRAKFDLTFGMGEYEESIGGAIEYRTDLFDDSTIDRMAGHLETVLTNMVRDPEQRLSSVQLMTETEQRQLVKWNHTTQEYPKERCVHQFFEAQVARTPEAVAVVCAGTQLTYRELNERANQVASWLQNLGVGPDVIVGICVERSLEMAVGVLGILKAGGAYLPLDPNYPQERLRFLLEDAQPRVLLTQDHLASTIPSSQAKIVSLDSQSQKFSQHSSGNPYSMVGPHNLAYVIYTSGSTGRPKGVLIEHRGLMNHCLAISVHFDLSTMDRVLQFASLSFDFAAEEIFPSLASGATLVLRTDKAIASIKEFVGFLQTERISIVNLPTSFWHEWVEQLTELVEPIPNTVRLVVVGGDEVLSDRFNTWRHVVGDQVRWCNTYGPTEATITATLYEPLLGELGKDPVSVPIGRPIPNVKAFVLDSGGQLVPIGIPGELHLSGVGLARGYLNRPELTQEKFIDSSLEGIPDHIRLYKTGDLARYQSDGNLEFLGRLDNQVKIRGFRIELGEIEAVLSRHPSVQEAVVLARDEGEGDKRLVAYVVGKPEIKLDFKDLREFLTQHLPAYMVATAFVPLSALPQTSNGKIDYQTLTSLPLIRNHEVSYAPPQNDLETKMTRIWEEILNVAPIGRHENFFSLGGHSLLAVRLFSRIEKEFGESLSLATIFSAPTIERLTSMLSNGQQIGLGTSLVPIQPTGSLPPLFVVHLVGGNVLTYGNLSQYLGPDQPLYGLQSVGLDGSNKPYTRVEDMAAHYLREVQKVQKTGPYFLAGGCMGGLVAFEMAQQFLAKGEKVAFLGLIESWLPNGSDFQLSKFPTIWYLYRGMMNQVETIGNVGIRDWFPQGAGKLLKILKQADIYGGDQGSRNRDLVSTSNIRALGQYVPKPFKGKIVYFLASERKIPDESDHRMEWEKLADEGFKVFQVSAPDAGQMFMPPYVQQLASQIKSCLEEAQQSVR